MSGIGEESGLQQIEEKPKVFGIAPVWCRREEEEVRRLTREALAELIPLRSLNFVAVLIGSHLMRFVYDNQIEVRIRYGSSDVILPREIHGGNQLWFAYPDVLL